MPMQLGSLCSGANGGEASALCSHVPVLPVASLLGQAPGADLVLGRTATRISLSDRRAPIWNDWTFRYLRDLRHRSEVGHRMRCRLRPQREAARRAGAGSALGVTATNLGKHRNLLKAASGRKVSECIKLRYRGPLSCRL